MYCNLFSFRGTTFLWAFNTVVSIADGYLESRMSISFLSHLGYSILFVSVLSSLLIV